MSGLDVSLVIAVVLAAGGYLCWVMFGDGRTSSTPRAKPKTDDDDCCGPR